VKQVLWWHEKELSNKEIVLGVDHPDTLLTLDEMKMLKKLQTRKLLAEGSKMFKPVENWHEAVYGKKWGGGAKRVVL